MVGTDAGLPDSLEPARYAAIALFLPSIIGWILAAVVWGSVVKDANYARPVGATICNDRLPGCLGSGLDL